MKTSVLLVTVAHAGHDENVFVIRFARDEAAFLGEVATHAAAERRIKLSDVADNHRASKGRNQHFVFGQGVSAPRAAKRFAAEEDEPDCGHDGENAE